HRPRGSCLSPANAAMHHLSAAPRLSAIRIPLIRIPSSQGNIMTVSRPRLAALALVAVLAAAGGGYAVYGPSSGAGTAQAQAAPAATPVDVAPAFTRSIVDW